MNLFFTRQSLGATLVLFTLLVGLFWVCHLLSPFDAGHSVASQVPLGRLIDKTANGREWVHAAISLVFIYMTAICITRQMSRNLVFPVRTHAFLPLLAVVGFGIFIREGNSAAVVAMFLLARGSDYFASGFRRVSRAGDLFGGGLMFGLAPLFYAPAVMYLAMVPVAMLIYMRGLRESVLAFVGALSPVFAYLYILWATDGGFVWPTMRYVLPEAGVPQLVTAGLVMATVLASLGSLIGDAHKIRTRAYRIHLFMVCFLVVGLAGLRTVGDLPMVAVPVSVVAASWFSRHEGLVPTAVYLLTLISAVAIRMF